MRFQAVRYLQRITIGTRDMRMESATAGKSPVMTPMMT